MRILELPDSSWGAPQGPTSHTQPMPGLRGDTILFLTGLGAAAHLPRDAYIQHRLKLLCRVMDLVSASPNTAAFQQLKSSFLNIQEGKFSPKVKVIMKQPPNLPSIAQSHSSTPSSNSDLIFLRSFPLTLIPLIRVIPFPAEGGGTGIALV